MAKMNMAAFAAECFLPKDVLEMVEDDKEQEPEEVQDTQPSAAPDLAAIAAECFLPKG